jgi:hypothetical protein
VEIIMASSSSLLHQEDPNAIAKRLMQKAYNRDGLSEIAAGVFFLTIAGMTSLQVVFKAGSPAYKAAVWGWMLSCATLPLVSQWVIKKIRRRFLIEKVGYVELKPVSRKRFGAVFALAFLVAVAAVIAAYLGRNPFPPTAWVLAGTGIGGGVIGALAGRIPRFFIGGGITAATGIALAFSRVSLAAGFTILYGVIGLLSLVSGCVVLLLFLRQPAEQVQ